MSSERIPGILPYTLLQVDGKPTIVFMLWKDRKSSTIESASFWGHVVCPMDKNDKSPLEAVCRSFSLKTNASFAPAEELKQYQTQLADLVSNNSKSAEEEDFDEEDFDDDDFGEDEDDDEDDNKKPVSTTSADSVNVVQDQVMLEEKKVRLRRALLTSAAQSLRKKLVQAKGTTLLRVSKYLIYVAPVRFIAASELNQQLRQTGEMIWVDGETLIQTIRAIQPDEVNTTLSTNVFLDSTKSTSVRDDKITQVPLYLPFTAALRAPEAMSELEELFKSFGVSFPPMVSNTSESSSSSSSEVAEQLKEMSINSDEKKTDGSSNPSSTSSSSSSSTKPSTVNDPSVSKYHCAKCRHLLFTEKDIMPHSATFGRRSFAHKNYNKSQTMEDCSSYFLDRVPSLGEFTEDEGPISCPKCKTRIGYYVWSGSQCSCGDWITPALQIPRSKVDEKKPLAVASAVNGAPVVRPGVPIVAVGVRAPFRPTVVKPTISSNDSAPSTSDSSA